MQKDFMSSILKLEKDGNIDYIVPITTQNYKEFKSSFPKEMFSEINNDFINKDCNYMCLSIDITDYCVVGLYVKGNSLDEYKKIINKIAINFINSRGVQLC